MTSKTKISAESLPPNTTTMAGNPSKPSSFKDSDGDVRTGPAAAIPSFRKLFQLARPEWAMLGVAFVLMVATEVGTLYIPILLADAYDFLVDDTLSTDDRMSEINSIMALVLVIQGAGYMAGFLRLCIMEIAGERTLARLRNALYGQILKQEMAFFDEHKSGELISRLGSDTTLLQQATSTDVPEISLGLVKLCASIGLMFWISVKLAGFTVGLVLVIFVVCVPFGHFMKKLSKDYQDVLGEAQTHSAEALGAMRTVQAFAAETREHDRYKTLIGEPEQSRWWWPTKLTPTKTTYSVGFFKAITLSGFFNTMFGVGFGALFAVLWYGFKLVNDKEITLGELTAFQSYIVQIGTSLGQTSRYVSQLIEALGASGRIFYLLERVPTIPIPHANKDETNHRQDGKPASSSNSNGNGNGFKTQPIAKQPESMEGVIEYDSVDFSYPSRRNVPVLRGFSLSIPPNTTTALVGSSGCGKSTALALLQRFYDVDAGCVRVDGNDIRDLDLSWLRSKIGYVQQEPSLFGLSVRQNITYGMDREVSQEELDAVARKANAHDFIMDWPDNYDTLVGERGVKMSGGQRQRIAIARALLIDPRILLLDEATSALDAESEQLVQEAIEKAVVGRTVLIVAHRLSTIQNADQIVVLGNDHQIADIGPHAVLLERCDKYRHLIQRQFDASSSDETTILEDMSSSIDGDYYV